MGCNAAVRACGLRTVSHVDFLLFKRQDATITNDKIDSTLVARNDHRRTTAEQHTRSDRSRIYTCRERHTSISNLFSVGGVMSRDQVNIAVIASVPRMRALRVIHVRIHPRRRSRSRLAAIRPASARVAGGEQAAKASGPRRGFSVSRGRTRTSRARSGTAAASPACPRP